MDESEKVITRGWLMMLVGTALLTAGLVGLCFPVYLNSYDRYGVQIRCGNGYYAELLQATIGEQEQQSSLAGASPPVRPATDYVDQCKSALVHRRTFLLLVAAFGVLILIPELVAWSRAGEPDATHNADITGMQPSKSETALVTAPGGKRRVIEDRR